jgi:glycosyltransferase involved in cell wall biosynthesis
MKLLMATHYFESHRGGIEIVAGRLARQLRARGTDVTWLATDATPPPDAVEKCGSSVVIPAWNIAERRLGFPLPVPGPRGIATIWRAVKAADTVLLHDSLYPTNVVAMLAARAHAKPVVITQHIGSVPYSNPILRLLMRAANRLITRPMLAAADQVVFISETTAKHFADVRFHQPPQLIFNGVDTALFRPATDVAHKAALRRTLGLSVAQPVALFVGRFVEKKGLHILEQMARRTPDVHFVLAGWGPIDPTRWKLPNVTVICDRSGAELVPLYQASDTLVLPSTGEGLPLVIQEAMACGLPVLCGDETAGADKSAAKLVTGVAIDCVDHLETSANFTCALRQMLKQGDVTGAEAAARREHAVSNYSWTEAARKYCDAFASIAGSPVRGAVVLRSAHD